VNITKLPSSVKATRLGAEGLETYDFAVKDGVGKLLASAIPSVSILKEGGYFADDFGDEPAQEPDLAMLIEMKLRSGRLGGFVVEGLVPYGMGTSELRMKMLRKASYMGLPLVKVGRGYPEGFADPDPYAIAGLNLTATKARMLLMAALMKFGHLPAAANPEAPTPTEVEALKAAVAAYQLVFDTH
jgi:L-asparaginase